MRDKRFYKRINVNVDCVTYDNKTGTEINGKVKNISEDGICLSFPKNSKINKYYRQNDVMDISFSDNYSLFGQKKHVIMSLSAQIVYIIEKNECLLVGGNVKYKVEYEQYVSDKKLEQFLDTQIVKF